jgi:hypothetical protein
MITLINIFNPLIDTLIGFNIAITILIYFNWNKEGEKQ